MTYIRLILELCPTFAQSNYFQLHQVLLERHYIHPSHQIARILRMGNESQLMWRISINSRFCNGIKIKLKVLKYKILLMK